MRSRQERSDARQVGERVPSLTLLDVVNVVHLALNNLWRVEPLFAQEAEETGPG